MKHYIAATPDEIEPLLGIAKQSLIQHVHNARISLAVMEHTLGMPLYSNLSHEQHNAHHFETCASNRFIYIHQNVISLNEDLTFTDGKIPFKSIVNFEKSPIGHPDNGLSKDAFRADFGSEYYEKWWYETNAEKECSVYLTCDAIQHSPMRELYMMSLVDQDLPEPKIEGIKPTVKKTLVVELRLRTLKDWIGRQENFNPHNHSYTRSDLWGELTILDVINFLVQTSGLGATPEAFF